MLTTIADQNTFPDNVKSRALASDSIAFGIITTDQQKKKIYDLRDSVYGELQWNHLLVENKGSLSSMNDKIDDHAYIFFLAIADNIIASCRVVPIQLNPVFLEKLLLINPSIDYSYSVVIERLVLNQNFRDAITYKRLLATVCHWIGANTSNVMWYAKCNEQLTRLYLKFKAKVIGSEHQEVAGNVTRKYHYLQGIIRETLLSNSKHILPYK